MEVDVCFGPKGVDLSGVEIASVERFDPFLRL